MNPALFSSLDIGPINVPNRIAVAPMCQYSAVDGCATDWHLQHLMTLAMSGAGLVTLEATAVERSGRITHGCLGLYSDANEAALGRALAAARSVALPGTRFGIQISHAGRKGSAMRPWEGGMALGAGDDPWPTSGASAIPHDAGWPAPNVMDETDLKRVSAAFAETARRAARLGFDAIELHLAHGYLLHTFHSPLSNHRSDAWGGDAERRSAFPLAVARAVRAAVPDQVALGARITGTDWEEGGLKEDDAVAITRDLSAADFHYVCVTTGGIPTKTPIAVGPGYQVSFAQRVREETGLVTRAVGMIVNPVQAEEIIRTGAADQVALGRGILDNPRWGWHAAEVLGAKLPGPPQYERARAGAWPGAALRGKT